MFLDLQTPTRERVFTYYDQAAIRLDDYEKTAVRIRVVVTVVASPLYRAKNFKYSFPKEFFGYAQGFSYNLWVADYPINYQSVLLYDYWNQHGTIIHQLADIIERLNSVIQAIGLGVAALTLAEFIDISTAITDALENIVNILYCLSVELDGGEPDNDPTNDYLNTFQQPVNLFRFKFPFGTVFQVSILSWSMGTTTQGRQPGNTNPDAPYDTTNPGNNIVEPTDPAGNPGNPYGFEPPDSSPLDPTLDPNDFSNAPDPPPLEFQCIRVTGNVQIQGLDGEPRAINIVYGGYENFGSASWESAPSGGGTTIYNFTVRTPEGVVIDIPITGDLLGTAGYIPIACP